MHVQTNARSLATLSARRRNRSHHELRCLEIQARRSLETGGLEWDLKEDQEVIGRVEERAKVGRAGRGVRG